MKGVSMPAGARLAALAMTIVSAAVFLIATVPSRLPEHVASAEPVNSGTTGIRTGASGLLATDPGPEELNAAPYKNGGFAIEFAIRPAAFGGNTVGFVRPAGAPQHLVEHVPVVPIQLALTTESGGLPIA